MHNHENNKIMYPRDLVSQRSPVRLVIITAISVFMVEMMLMITFYLMQPIPEWSRILIDSTLLVILLSPIFYFFLFRPQVRNLADRDAALTKVNKQQFLLEKAQELGNIGSWDLDIVNNVLAWTDENCRIFGVPAGTIVNYEIFIDKVHPEDREYVNAEWGEVLKGKPYDVEHRILIDGIIKWVRQKADIESDPDGNAIKAIGFTQDITIQKESNRAIVEGEDRFRSLFEKAPISYQSLDENGNLIAANETFCSLLGFSQEEVLGKNFAEFLHPDSQQTFKINFPKFKQMGLVKNVEFRLRKKDGTFVDILLDGKIGYKEDGSFKQTHCVFQDLTERKQIEKALQLAEIQYRDLVEGTTDLVTRVDMAGIFIFVNHMSEKMLGVNPAECIGLMAFDFVHEEDRESTKRWFNEWINSKDQESTFENRQVNKKTGDICWMLWTANVEFDEKAVPIAVNSIARDITERKQAVEALQESETRFRTITEHSPDAIFLTDQQGNYTYVNQAASDLLGYSLEELIEMNVTDLAANSKIDEGSTSFQDLLQRGRIFTELTLVRKDGTFIPVDLNAVILPNGSVYGSCRDLTQRKRTDKALKESEIRFHNLVDSTDGIVWEADAQTFSFIYVSQKAKRLLGYEIEDWYQANFWASHLHKDDKDYAIQYCVSCTEKLQNHDFEYRFINKSGEIIWLHDIVNVVEEDGKPRWLRGIMIDITERKQAEETLKASESNLLLGQRIAQLGFWSLNPETQEVTGTDELLRIFDLTLDEMTLDRFIEVVHPDDREYDLEHIQRGIEKGIPWDIEHRLLLKDGTIKWIHTIGEAKTDGNGKVFKVEGITQDITERKWVEQDVAQLTATLEAAQEMVKLGSWSFDIATQMPTWSDMMFVVFGLNKEDGVPSYKEHQKIWNPDDWETFDKAVQECSKGKPYNLVVRILFPDGSYHYINTQGFPRYDDAGNIPELFGISQDITAEKLEEQERLALETQLRQAQKLEAVGTMVGGIAHEFNNVLQGMFLYAGLVKKELPSNESLQANFQRIMNGAEKARDIVKQILVFSRKSTIDLQPHTIHDVVLEALSLERASLPANIDIKQEVDLNCGQVLCDRTQINQIIINLCNNAQHAMGEKGGILSVSLHKTQAPMSDDGVITDALELKISDTGCGIDPSDLEQIFDPFYTSKEVGQGTGLGLSVVHGIVEMMQGQISVSSELNMGTTFRILLPLSEELTEETFPEMKLPLDKLKLSILLVDDAESIREATRDVLIQEGFSVDVASDGKQALELFQANPAKYDVIVTDQTMPKMSGTDLSREIQKSGSNIPILLSTGLLGVESKKEYQNIGISGFIQKPWTAVALIERLRGLGESIDLP